MSKTITVEIDRLQESPLMLGEVGCISVVDNGNRSQFYIIVPGVEKAKETDPDMARSLIHNAVENAFKDASSTLIEIIEKAL